MTRFVAACVWLAIASPVMAQESDPTPEESPSATPDATPEATPEPSPSPDARDLGAEIDALRSEVERLRESVEPETQGDDPPRRNGLRSADLSARAPGTLRLGGVGTAAAVIAEEKD